MVGPVRVQVDNKGMILRRGDSKCIKPRAGDADLWIKIWEGLHGLVERGILVEVEHVTPFFRLVAPARTLLFWSHFGDRDGF